MLEAGAFDDEHKEVLQCLARFVKDGSYLMFIGEDNAQWAWVFRRDPESGEVKATEEDVVPVLASELARLEAGQQ